MLNSLIKENENKYKEYIDNHRLNVQKAWANMKSNTECLNLISKYLNTNEDTTIYLIDDMIKCHDLSKYEQDEFDAYRKNFYPISPEEKELNKSDFDTAWKHHYHNNMHHWNWWYETGNMNNMKLQFVVEMICDWEAMGYVFGNNSKQFYEQNINKIHLGDTQRKFAEDLMNIICL